MKKVLPLLLVAGAIYFIWNKNSNVKKSPTTDSPDTNPGNTSVSGKYLHRATNTRFPPQYIMA